MAADDKDGTRLRQRGEDTAGSSDWNGRLPERLKHYGRAGAMRPGCDVRTPVSRNSKFVIGGVDSEAQLGYPRHAIPTSSRRTVARAPEASGCSFRLREPPVGVARGSEHQGCSPAGPARAGKGVNLRLAETRRDANGSSGSFLLLVPSGHARFFGSSSCLRLLERPLTAINCTVFCQSSFQHKVQGAVLVQHSSPAT